MGEKRAKTDPKEKEKMTELLKTKVTMEMKKQFDRELEKLRRTDDGLRASDLLRRAVRWYLDSLNPNKARSGRIKRENDDAV